jgi:uncharacterized protein
VDDEAAWRAEVESERAARDAHYRGEDTPLSPEARKTFRGLRWWPIEARWRVEARLARHPVPLPGRLGATGPDAIALLEVGAFDLALLGQPCRLLAFAPAPGEADEDYLLIPFRDATSGRETYGAGRYLDLEPHAGERYVLDFNRAYHPYCAHDDAWSCALPPPENRLPFKVEAGERL